jgi:hypothetical protein
MAVTEKVLASQQHLQRGVRHEPFERSQPIPWIFVQVPDAGVVGRATPALDRPVACVIEVLAGAGHVLYAESGGDQALVCIPKCEFGYVNDSVDDDSVFLMFDCRKFLILIFSSGVQSDRLRWTGTGFPRSGSGNQYSTDLSGSSCIPDSYASRIPEVSVSFIV